MLFLRDAGPTEVGGFGLTPAEDLLYVEDICLVRQACTAVFVKFDDVAVAEFFEEQVEAGRRPERFARVWIHTHPGDSATPSHVDERTFRRVFGCCDWAVMFILAQGGQAYARIRYGVGPGGEMQIPVTVDFSRPFAASDLNSWQREYMATVQPLQFGPMAIGTSQPSGNSNEAPPELSLDEFFYDDLQERRDLEFIGSI